MKKCPNCGKDMSNGSKFCSSCGTMITETGQKWFCKNCGAQMNGNASFCPYCGAQTVSDPIVNDQPISNFQQSQAEQQSVAHVQYTQRKTHKSCWIIPLVFLAIYILFSIIGSSQGSKSSGTNSNDFLSINGSAHYVFTLDDPMFTSAEVTLYEDGTGLSVITFRNGHNETYTLKTENLKWTRKHYHKSEYNNVAEYDYISIPGVKYQIADPESLYYTNLLYGKDEKAERSEDWGISENGEALDFCFDNPHKIGRVTKR